MSPNSNSFAGVLCPLLRGLMGLISGNQHSLTDVTISTDTPCIEYSYSFSLGWGTEPKFIVRTVGCQITGIPSRPQFASLVHRMDSTANDCAGEMMSTRSDSSHVLTNSLIWRFSHIINKPLGHSKGPRIARLLSIPTLGMVAEPYRCFEGTFLLTARSRPFGLCFFKLATLCTGYHGHSAFLGFAARLARGML